MFSTRYSKIWKPMLYWLKEIDLSCFRDNQGHVLKYLEPVQRYSPDDQCPSLQEPAWTASSTLDWPSDCVIVLIRSQVKRLTTSNSLNHGFASHFFLRMFQSKSPSAAGENVSKIASRCLSERACSPRLCCFFRRKTSIDSLKNVLDQYCKYIRMQSYKNKNKHYYVKHICIFLKRI